MADILLTVGVDIALSFAEFQAGIQSLVSSINANPPKIKVQLDDSSLSAMRQQLEELHRAAASGATSGNAGSMGANTSDVNSNTAAINANTQARRQNTSAATEAANATRNAAAEQKMLTADAKEYYTALSKINTLLKQVRNNVGKWSAAKNGDTGGAYENLKSQIAALEALQRQLQNGTLSVEQFNRGFNNIKSTVTDASNRIKDAGKNYQSFGDKISSIGKKFATWFGVTRIITTAIQTCKKMVATYMEIEDSMTQIKIVTGATDSQMEEFFAKATSMAQELGQKISDVSSSIETFSRLGYNLGDASELAKYANIMSNVANVDTGTATTGLTSIIKGYNIDVADAEHISDVLVKVGQEYAISAEELMAAFQRGGAALAASGTSFEKSAALFAATNASLQNAQTTGTMWKTVSARIRGATTELEEMGEATDGLAGGLSKYRDEIRDLSGVDIMKDEKSYKDMYDIFVQLAQVWDGMKDDMSRSRVAEILGGTRNTSGIMSTITNIKDAMGAYESAMDSAGTAMTANNTYMETTSAHVDQLKASFEELSYDFFNSSSMKVGVDVLKGLVEAIDAVVDSVGALGISLGALGIGKVIKQFATLSKDAKGLAKLSFFKQALTESFPRITNAITNAIADMSRAGANGAGMLGKLAAGAKAFASAFSPLTLIIAGVSAALAAFFLIQNKQNKELQQKVDAAKEAGKAWEESSNSIQSYTDRISELRAQLASGTLSEEEAYNAKSELLSIQEKLSESYGRQVEGIDLVNGSLQEQIGLLNQINQEKANKFLNENQEGIDEATRRMEEVREYPIGFFYKEAEGSDSIQAAIQKIKDKYGDVITTVDGTDGGLYLYLNADATQAENALNDLMTELRQIPGEIEDTPFLKPIFDSVKEGLEEVNKITAEDGGLYEQSKAAAVTGDMGIYTDAKNKAQSAADWMDDYTKAIERYNTALAMGDTTEISAAAEEFSSVDNSIQGLLEDSEGLGKFSTQFKNALGALNTEAIANFDFKSKLEEAAALGDEAQKSGVLASEGIARYLQIIKDAKLDDIDFQALLLNPDTSEVGTAISELGECADNAGVSTDFLVSSLLNLGIITGDIYDKTTRAAAGTQALAQRIENFKTLQGTLQSALSNSKSATGLTTEEIQKLQEAYSDLEGYNPYRLFEETANGVHLNSDELKKLNKELDAKELENFADKIQYLQEQIYDERKKGSDTSALENELMQTQLLKSQYEGLASAYNAWLTAKSGGKERDSYESIGSSYEEMQKTLEQGWYGDESLNAYLDLLLSAEQRTGDAAADFEKLTQTIDGTSHSIMDYWKFDEDNNLVSDGLFDFLDDVNLKLGDSFAHLNEDGKYEFDFNGDKLQEVADAFGISTEAVELFERALIDSGMAIDLSDLDFTGQVNKAKEALEDLQESGKVSKNIDLSFDTSTAPLGDLKSYINTLKNERIKINAETDPKAAAALDELIAKCERDYYFRLNMSTDGGLSHASLIIAQMQASSELYFSVDVQMSEITSLAEQLANLPQSVQVAVGIRPENVGNVEGIVNQWKDSPESISIPVGFSPDTSEADSAVDKINANNVDDKSFTIDAVDNASPKIQIIKENLDKLNDKSITVTTVEKTVKKAEASKNAEVSGTAHADGTAFRSTKNHIYPVNAYASGQNWSLMDDEDALVNELGTESIVRDGKWYPLPGGAHVAQLKKGDIIFSAEQTKELLKSGRVTAGGGHGKRALADGTAFNTLNLNAYENGTGGSRRPNSGVGTHSPGASSSNKGSSNSDSKSDKKKDKKDNSKIIDWIEIAISRIERAIDRLATTATSPFKGLSKRLAATNKELSKMAAELSIQKKGYHRYRKEAKSVSLSGDLKKKVRKGTIDITKYDEKTAEKIENYQKWYEKAMECRDAIQELRESMAELYQNKFNDVATHYENKLSTLEHLTTTYNNNISEIEERGYLSSTKYYEALQDVERKNIKLREKELDSLTKKMNEAVNSGRIKKGSEAWYEMQQEINAVKEAIQESGIEIIKLGNSIREVKWGHFDYLQEQIGQVAEEAEFLISLMENSKLYDDTGQLTDTGMATMGMHGQNYNVYMAQADRYAKEIMALDKEIAKDPYNTKLLDRRKELIEAQRESILAANGEKKAIRDMVEEGINIELDALQKLIDTYTDALDSAKDLYDYQKKVSSQTSEISKLRKQLAAYAGDTSEENRAVIQRLQVSLEEAEADLEETQYENYITEQKKLLDSLYTEYEEVLNQRLDNTDVLLSDMIDRINANADSISTTLTAESEKVGYTLSENMQNIWMSSENTASIIMKYGDSFSSSLTSVNSVLNSIANYVALLAAAGDTANNTDGNGSGSSGKDKKDDPNKNSNSGSSSSGNITAVVTTQSTKHPILGSFGNIPTATTLNDSKPKKPSSTEKKKKRTEKENHGVALAIWNGGYGWGTGDTQSKRLKAKGFDTSRVKSIVNKMGKDGYVQNGTWPGKYHGIKSLAPYHYNKFKKGGLVDYTGLAQLDGTPGEPELVLNSKDTANFIELKDALQRIADGTSPLTNIFAENPVPDIIGSIGKIDAPSSPAQAPASNITYEVNIPIDHVSDYNDFANQMRRDGKFEKMIHSMTLKREEGTTDLLKEFSDW